MLGILPDVAEPAPGPGCLMRWYATTVTNDVECVMHRAHHSAIWTRLSTDCEFYTV